MKTSEMQTFVRCEVSQFHDRGALAIDTGPLVPAAKRFQDSEGWCSWKALGHHAVHGQIAIGHARTGSQMPSEPPARPLDGAPAGILASPPSVVLPQGGCVCPLVQTTNSTSSVAATVRAHMCNGYRAGLEGNPEIRFELKRVKGLLV